MQIFHISKINLGILSKNVGFKRGPTAKFKPQLDENFVESQGE